MMEVTKSAKVRLFLVFLILWPFGCSMIQPKVHVNMPSPIPGSRTTENIPGIRSQQVSLPETLPPSPPEANYFTHEIKWPGENLGWIARWYTGSSKNWMHLVEANPGINPRRINIGDSVLIPEALLKTRRPMPIDFLSSATSKRKKPSPLATKQPDRSDKIELFGPIDTETQTIGVDDSHSPLPLETIE